MNDKRELKNPFWFPLGIFLSLLVLAIFAYKSWEQSSKQQENQSELYSLQQLILSQDDVINTNWLRTLNPLVKNVEGRLVWSTILQEGVMEFFGLPDIANNQKYQLWIYDLSNEDSKPIFSKEFSDVESQVMLVPFASKDLIISPFKFELTLKTENQEGNEPLFLAQP